MKLTMKQMNIVNILLCCAVSPYLISIGEMPPFFAVSFLLWLSVYNYEENSP